MDSGSPGVGGTPGTTVGCVGGLESILKYKRMIIWFNLSINQSADPKAELRAYLNVSDAPLSQFASTCAGSHCAGNAAESSTELTEAK